MCSNAHVCVVAVVVPNMNYTMFSNVFTWMCVHVCVLRLQHDLKKPLRVAFIGPGGVPEEGLDEGGVSREFFQLLV